jgi:hypothetical protein
VAAVATKTTKQDRRFDQEHMADTLYSMRVKADTKRGRGARHIKLEAAAIYKAGVHDTLTALLEWQKSGMEPSTLSALMCQLHDQTKLA